LSLLNKFGFETLEVLEARSSSSCVARIKNSPALILHSTQSWDTWCGCGAYHVPTNVSTAPWSNFVSKLFWNGDVNPHPGRYDQHHTMSYFMIHQNHQPSRRVFCESPWIQPSIGGGWHSRNQPHQPTQDNVLELFSVVFPQNSKQKRGKW
jgi:hypothetical protein